MPTADQQPMAILYSLALSFRRVTAESRLGRGATISCNLLRSLSFCEVGTWQF